MMQKLERILLSEVAIKYPRQYIVLVNIRKEPKLHDKSGEIYMVDSDPDTAYKVHSELDKSYGSTTIIRGFDDTPEIGGLSL